MIPPGPGLWEAPQPPRGCFPSRGEPHGTQTGRGDVPGNTTACLAGRMFRFCSQPPPALFPRGCGCPARLGAGRQQHQGHSPPQKPLLGWGHRGLAGLGGSWGAFFVGRRGEVRRSGSLISASQSHGLIVCQDERVRWKGWSCSKSPLQSLPRARGHPRRCQSGGAGRQRAGAAVWGGLGGQPQVGQGAGHLQVALFRYPRASFCQEGSQGRFGKGKGQAGGLMCGKGGREGGAGF